LDFEVIGFDVPLVEQFHFVCPELLVDGLDDVVNIHNELLDERILFFDVFLLLLDIGRLFFLL
jgi:hypothetical protein